MEVFQKNIFFQRWKFFLSPLIDDRWKTIFSKKVSWVQMAKTIEEKRKPCWLWNQNRMAFFGGEDIVARKSNNKEKNKATMQIPERLSVWDAHAYFTKKILHHNRFNGNLKKRKMEGATKERAIWYLKFCIEVVLGVENPCNGLYASLLSFRRLNSRKIRFKMSEKKW